MKHLPIQTVMLAIVVGLIVLPTEAFGQTYQVAVEESGPLPTVYTKRNNWRILPDFRHTTMVANAEAPTQCAESPCLDDELPGGGAPPDSTRGGTATAIVPDMIPGRYRLELRYNQTANRATAIPWIISTNAETNHTRSGTLNQRATSPGASKWIVLADTDQAPLDVESTATFVFGSDAVTFDGSLSYGGIQLVRIGDLTSPDAGDAGGSPACPELLSDEYANPEATLSVALGSTARLSFVIDNVPDPVGLDQAALSMWVRDADHPGQEGTVFVNGYGPLSLPAHASWNDITAQTSLPIPVAYLHTGHNLVEFGAGALATTNYSVSRVALNVQGSACAPQPDATAPQDAVAEHAVWPVDSGSVENSAEDASHDAMADGAVPGVAPDRGDDPGCACSTGHSASSLAGWLLLGLLAGLGLRRGC